MNLLEITKYERYSLDELENLAYNEQNYLAMVMHKSVVEKIAKLEKEEERLSRAMDDYSMLVHTIDEVNDSLASNIAWLLIDIIEAKGGKRKTKEALKEFQSRFEDMGGDTLEHLTDFRIKINKTVLNSL